MKNRTYRFKVDKEIRVRMFFSLISLLIIQGLALIPPVIMRKIIDIHIPEGNMKAIISSVMIFIFIPLVITMVNALYNYKSAVYARYLGKKLTVETFSKLMKQPLEFFNDKNSSELTTQCNRDFMNYISFWVKDIPSIITSTIIILVVLFILFDINMYMGMVQTLFIPLVILPQSVILKKLKVYFQFIFDKKAQMNQLITDSFRNLPFIKSMQLEEERAEGFWSIEKPVMKIWGRIVAYEQLVASGSMQFFKSVFTGVGFIIGAILVTQGHISIGLLVSYVSYLPRLFYNAETLINTNYNFRKKLVEYEKAFEYLSLADEFGNDNVKKAEFNYKETLMLKNISLRYKGRDIKALENINMVFPKNKWIGIIGESGAGKSSIFNLLLALYKPDKGEIYVDSENYNDISLHQIRKNISRVAQDTCFFNGSIKDNLLLVNQNATGEDIDRSLKITRLESFISRLDAGLQTKMGEAGKNMSGGERQRLSLAQGILRNSQILLLDEVTSNIDTIAEAKIQEAILNIRNSTEKTIISISHNLEFLSRVDYLYVLENGRIVDEGTYNEVRKRNSLFNNSI